MNADPISGLKLVFSVETLCFIYLVLIPNTEENCG